MTAIVTGTLTFLLLNPFCQYPRDIVFHGARHIDISSLSLNYTTKLTRDRHTGICFLLSVPLAPIFASIPSWATGCTLILVGTMMTSGLQSLNWKKFNDVIPCFVTFIIMPYTESIAYGMVAGLMTSIIINFFLFFFCLDREVKQTKLQRWDEFRFYFTREPFFPAWNVRLYKWLKARLNKNKLKALRMKVHGFVATKFGAVVLYIREANTYWDVSRVLATLNAWGYSVRMKIYQ